MTRTPFAALAVLAAALLHAATGDEPPRPASLPPYGQDRPLVVPDIAVERLENGLTVWLVPRPGLPKLTALLAVRGGMASDPDELAGLAEVLAQTVKAGTTSRSARHIAEELQGVGGELSAQAWSDVIVLQGDALSEGGPTLLAILADVAANATFPPREVELARSNALEALKVAAATPEFAVEQAFSAAVFASHPYHRTAPTEVGLAAVTPDRVKAEYLRRFQPERALLLVVGAFDAPAVRTRVRSLFAPWRGGRPGPPPTPAQPAAAAQRVFILDRPGSVQSEIRIGRPTVAAGDPDVHALEVANTIFGGAFSSRLVDNLRERHGYTYAPFSDVTLREAGGILEVSAAVGTDVTAPAIVETLYELDRMAAGAPSADEVERAKRYLTGVFLLRNQIQESLVATLARLWLTGQPPTALAEYVPRVQAVDVARVLEVSRRVYPARGQTVVIGGDVEAIRPGLEPVLGPPIPVS